MKQGVKLLSLFMLTLFLSVSFLSLSQSLHHSLDAPDTPLHFHTSADDTDHHNKPHGKHSDEETKTIISLDQPFIRIASHSLDLIVLVSPAPHPTQLYIESKDYIGKLSGVDPPNVRSYIRSYYPNAPPSQA